MAVQKSKVTLFDVAKASGVSSSAVSYALNGKSGVSEDTRAKVLKIAHELGWKPNGAAQASISYATELASGIMSEIFPYLGITKSSETADTQTN